MLPNPFSDRTPSTRVTRQSYPEQWAWWGACRWEMMVEDMPDGGLQLHSTRKGKVSGGIATANEVSTAAGVQRFLALMLYQHLHPRKAQHNRTVIGSVATDEQLVAFENKQRHTAAYLAL